MGNVATGSVKFTIPLHQTVQNWNDGCDIISSQDYYAPITGELIIAGDGYAYLLYEYDEQTVTDEWGGGYCNSTELLIDHVRLLRVASDGTPQEINLGDWTMASSSSGPYPFTKTQDGTVPDILAPGNAFMLNSSVVTNADSGVTVALNYYLLGYCAYSAPPNIRSGCVPEQDFQRLVAVSGGSIVSDLNVTPPNGTSVLTPVLQAQDGSYFGTQMWNSGNNYYSFMEAFDVSGNLKWSVPNFTPVIATADGGGIAQLDNQYVTFDNNYSEKGMKVTSYSSAPR